MPGELQVRPIGGLWASAEAVDAIRPMMVRAKSGNGTIRVVGADE